jgi:hypothetical protein
VEVVSQRSVNKERRKSLTFDIKVQESFIHIIEGININLMMGRGSSGDWKWTSDGGRRGSRSRVRDWTIVLLLIQNKSFA